MADAASRPQGPLSPHLQIYRRGIHMMMSIVHRITGVALYFGMLLLAWWLIAAATGPDYFGFVNGLLASLPGKIVLAGFSWALIHHLLGGVRHLIWDTGRGLDLSSVRVLSWLTILGSLLLTGLLWAALIKLKGVWPP